MAKNVTRETKALPAKPMSVKRQTFVQNIGKGMTQTAAYMDAYGVENETYAFSASSRLIRNDKVAAAIAQLQNRVAKRAEIDAATIVRRLNQIAVRAAREKQYPSAIQANTILGKQLFGMFRDDPAQINLNLGFASRALPGMELDQLELLVMARLGVKR